jgi:hypothetical protein
MATSVIPELKPNLAGDFAALGCVTQQRLQNATRGTHSKYNARPEMKQAINVNDINGRAGHNTYVTRYSATTQHPRAKRVVADLRLKKRKKSDNK